jgi:hypothetical protein
MLASDRRIAPECGSLTVTDLGMPGTDYRTRSEAAVSGETTTFCGLGYLWTPD